jgi:hypothetical protein
VARRRPAGWSVLIDMLALTRLRLQGSTDSDHPRQWTEVRSKRTEIDQRPIRSMESKLASRWCCYSRAEPAFQGAGSKVVNSTVGSLAS